MAQGLGSRVKAARELARLSQTQLAKKAGISQGAISHLENGTSESTKYIGNIAAALNLTVEELLSPGDVDTGPQQTGPNEKNHPVHRDVPGCNEPSEYVVIPQYDVTASCGSGALVGDVTVKGGLVFERSWIRSIGRKPENLAVIHAQGSSMAPTIEDDQVLLVDTSETTPMSSKVYLLCADGQLYIKRLINMFDGWVMRSDNPDKDTYPDIVLTAERMSNIQIQGRVIWQSGML